MKLLKVKIPEGYKMLAKGFEINFLTKTRINKDNPNEGLFLLDNDFYYPIETIFIGKNSSGKSTVLSLIEMIIKFLNSGRMEMNPLCEQNIFSLEILFYESGFIYKYVGSFERNDSFGVGSKYMIIKGEYLSRTSLKASYKKDLSNASFTKDSLIKPNIDGDTSSISTFVTKDLSVNVSLISAAGLNLANMINAVNIEYGNDVFNKIVHIFDDSVDYIKPYYDNGNFIGFNFKRSGSKSRIMNELVLFKILSSGTVRGIYIFLASILAFRHGGYIMIDEIEKSFNKNLVSNLIMLFNDSSINKAHASLIYTTHYSELLDITDRSDNINVLHRSGTTITLKNLHSDYSIRTELSKSKQFEQNAFDTLANYDRLMNLRRLLDK